MPPRLGLAPGWPTPIQASPMERATSGSTGAIVLVRFSGGPVEGLHGGAVRHAGGLDLRHGTGEGLHAGAAHLAAPHIGLNVEADLRGVGVADQLVDVLELGDPVALDDVLLQVAVS